MGHPSAEHIYQLLLAQHQSIPNHNGVVVTGKLVRSIGQTIEAIGPNVAIGSLCFVQNNHGTLIEAEVIGFNQNSIYLMSVHSMEGLSAGNPVYFYPESASIRVSQALIGRVVDGRAMPIDDRGTISNGVSTRLIAKQINPLTRAAIDRPLDVGVRAINGLLTMGEGQRVGLFAGTGVGKSVLLGMMTKYTQADVVVIGLIGERGREVRDFIEELGEEGMQKTVMVATPADETPLMRLNGAYTATSIAEHFCAQGKKVLLIIDSLTRFAQAQREIGLAMGEPPTTKAYPPSVFSKLPQLIERAGNFEGARGSITAVYTILTEGDDLNDPIADAARGVLDGHIVLSRELAQQGIYPAIDVEASISRLLTQVTSEAQRANITRFRYHMATYRKHEDLINIGAYAKGSDPGIDLAIDSYPKCLQYQTQGLNTAVSLAESIQSLDEIMREEGAIYAQADSPIATI